MVLCAVFLLPSFRCGILFHPARRQKIRGCGKITSRIHAWGTKPLTPPIHKGPGEPQSCEPSSPSFFSFFLRSLPSFPYFPPFSFLPRPSWLFLTVRSFILSSNHLYFLLVWAILPSFFLSSIFFRFLIYSFMYLFIISFSSFSFLLFLALLSITTSLSSLPIPPPRLTLPLPDLALFPSISFHLFQFFALFCFFSYPPSSSFHIVLIKK